MVRAIVQKDAARPANVASLGPSRATVLAMISGYLLCGCQKLAARGPDPLEYGILIQRYHGRRLLESDADRAFPAASISKLLVAIAFLEQETSSADLGAETAEVTFSAFSAINRFFPSALIGSRISAKLLITQMIEQSDDFSANVLIDHLGLPHINSIAKRINLSVLRVHGLFYDTTAPIAPRGYTTARDCNKMLRYILFSARAKSRLSSGYEYLLNIMSRQSDRRFIPAAVPRGTEVANKTGEIHDELNDVAIIEPFTRDPVLFTILAHGHFSIFTDQDIYRRAVLAVQRHARSAYEGLDLSSK